MAALDLSAPSQLPRIVNETLSGTPGNVRLVNLPQSADIDVTFVARATPAKLLDGTNTQAEDAAIGGSAYLTLKADTAVTMSLARLGGVTKCYLASGSASQVVEIMLTRRMTPA